MRSAFLLGFLALSGCASAPGYRSPAVDVPASFREMGDSNRSSVAVASGDAVSASYLAPATRAAHGAPPDPSDRPVLSSDYWAPLGDTTLSRLIGAVAGVSATWDLDIFGRIRQGVQAQGALVSVAQEELRDVQVSLTAELAAAYFELRGAQEQLQVARQNAENQRRTFDLTRQRLEAGRGSAFDTDRAQAQLSTTLASIPAREAQVAAAQYRIGTLVGRSPTEVAHELERPDRLPLLPEVTTIEQPEVVVRYRPDVAAAERFAAA